MPLLQADDRVARVVGVARRPFDPAAFSWTKLEYRRGAVRESWVPRFTALEALRDTLQRRSWRDRTSS